jgi:peptidoglycan/LPS O-acetylase OafA/YrhL
VAYADESVAVGSPEPLRAHPSQKREPLSTSFLDALRGLSALYVVLHHAFWLCQEGYHYGYLRDPQHYRTWQKAWALFGELFRYGHEAVLFFFVLSGFVIHLRYSRRLAADPRRADFGWLDFVGRRARRLYPPLLFALIVTFVLDRFGSHLGFPIYSGNTPYPLINFSVTSVTTGKTLLGNLAFLMNTYVPCWGSDGPLWSLKYEWWFYMVYPCLWPVARRSIALTTALMAALFVAGHFSRIWNFPIPALALARDIFSMMLVWWLGAMLADVYTGRIKIRFSFLSPLILLLPVAAVLNLKMQADFPLLWGLGFCGLIASGFALQSAGRRLTAMDRLDWLGDMSYTLYVVHMPIIVFISGWLMSRNAAHLLPRDGRWAMLAAMLALLFAYAAHFVVEKPFLRRREPVRS